MYTLTCKFCGKEFESRFPQGNVCADCKIGTCLVCGKTFDRTWPYDQKTCSAKCRKKYAEIRDYSELNTAKAERMLAKYGVDNVAKLDSVKDRIKLGKQIGHEANMLPATRVPMMRVCKLCGKEFEAKGSQTICKNDHYKICEVCGKEFKIKDQARRTCSDKCYAQLVKKNQPMLKKICTYCGKEFETQNSIQKYCDGPHMKICPICGTEFDVTSYLKSGSDIPKTCNNLICKKEQSKQTCLQKYGVEISSQSVQAKQKLSEAYHRSKEQRKQTNLVKYGVEHASSNLEVRKKISEAISSEAWQELNKSKMMQKYGVPYAMQSRELATKRAQFHNYAEDGQRLDSKWEVAFYEFLRRNKIQFNAQVPIEFEYNSGIHKTFIDFQVGDLLFEVKGSHLLQGVFDHKQVVPIDAKLDLYRKHRVIIITDKESRKLFEPACGLKYTSNDVQPLIGVDIDLFMNPQFPFASDKPECFYKVRVDDDLSSYEGFYNELIRWKMILNRIEYVGGFISAKQVLTAMNVTRTCKQPSWFSESFAESIIKKYITSDTIVDPFAGWGTRCTAAQKLGKMYIGSDFNPELVSWHQRCGRDIKLCNAKEFKYDYECSVFICPPYSDPETGRCFEDYNFEGFTDSAKVLSQCDWLKIVMHNVPNAREYIMVCKIVDLGWEQYIVEEKINKSHLGENKEYVLVVKNNNQ